jgi:hypothetical protein
MKTRLPALLAPALALIALVAWAFASPVGSAPDDDYHLTSAWCAGPYSEETCTEAEQGDGTYEVPIELTGMVCYAFQPAQSAACQEALFDGDFDETVETKRGNFSGAYPPVFYSTMGLFTGDDVQASVLVMRIVTVLLFLAMTIALYVLLPVSRRPTLVWGWLVTTVPLGMFLLASNNPSSWAVIGVGSSWIALLGYFESSGRRRVLLGVLYALAVVIAAGSRADAAVFAGLGTLLVLSYVFRRRRDYVLAAILPVAMGIVALGFFFVARQSGSGIEGFSSRDSGEDGLSPFGRLAFNLLNVPRLWVGNFGQWGLGWLDTAMPAVVPLAVTAAFVVVASVGLGSVSRRKAVILGVLVAVLWLLPTYVLQQGGHLVGSQVQPRYLLPLVVMFGGMLAIAVDGKPIWVGRIQRVLVGAALILANFIALHMNIRRYVTGSDAPGWNLDVATEWWWDAPFSPMFVWLVGSIAYAGLVVLLLSRLGSGNLPRPLAAMSEPPVARATS